MKQEQVKAHFTKQADEYEKLMVKLVPHYLEQHQIIFDHLTWIEKDYPMTLTDHFSWLRSAGSAQVACQWRLYNFAITTARK